MYQIPKNLDLSKIIGQAISQIHIGKYDFQFDLGDVHFAVQSPIKLFKDKKVIALWQEGVWPEKGFIELFNLNVINFLIPDNYTIIIQFEESLELHLYDNSDQYESMQITIKSESISWII
ncbi:hypothetical protein [Leptospira haakeii]|uniref:Uncharacterized protein n=1 Tax=Leptospira haakeii TaxID=2023198 RepID=A0ABX4PL85_9LEPT|nr:hypothetical protein [Leptospira haakeii]PKA16405.1 hypothetical protein CH363_09825 [Leptospira haakeii]PKA19713.1 hypothetical protein CH377_10020 [Leptospira haakeii]